MSNRFLLKYFGDLDQNLRILFESHMISTWEKMSSIFLEVFVHLYQNLSIFLTSNIFNKCENMAIIFLLKFLFIFIKTYWYFLNQTWLINDKICMLNIFLMKFWDLNPNLCIFFQSNMIDKWDNVSNVFFLMFLLIFIRIYWFFHDLTSWISDKLC